MKSFKEYLMESKRVYEFKVKIAGECPKDCGGIIKAALQQFKVESCSSGKSTPIQERQNDFPDTKNISVTVFDVTTSYPATSAQIRDKVAEACAISHSMIKVRNSAEQAEEELNHEHDESKGKTLLGTDFEPSNNQKVVGDKHTMALLKELGKTKHGGTQYKGVNDQLFAGSSPTETVKEQDSKQHNVSPVGSRKVKKPTAKTAGGLK